MTGLERSSLWRERLADLSASGLTQKQWCEQKGVPVHQLAYWKQRLSSAEPARASRGGVDWCPVQMIASDVTNSLEVRVGVAHIQVRAGFDPQLLAGVVRVLAGAQAGVGEADSG